MICEKCGTVYDGSFCPNGCNSPAAVKKAKKPIFKKWWFWVLIAVAVIAIASAGGEDSQTPSAGGSSETDATVSTTTEAADSTYHPGDVIDANGLKITYVRAEKFEQENMFMQPEAGYQYIRLYLSVENTSSTDKYISSFEFTCYADGKKQESHYTSEDALEGGTLSASRKDEGYIYFEVPMDAEQIEVEYETSFWSDKKAILSVELDG